MYLGWEKVSCLVRCPGFSGVLMKVSTVLELYNKGVLFREVSWFQWCPNEGFHCIRAL